MIKNNTYDVAIIGAGLAGLSLAIQMVKGGRTVALFEKETFPFHKVCGEYISMESWNFLVSLGIDLPGLGVPRIDTLVLTAPDGSLLKAPLPLGGFGISRYKLDSLLAGIARTEGVVIMESTKVASVDFVNDSFVLSYGSGMNIHATVCCAAYGKRSNLDVKWKRSFLQSGHKKLHNYIGVKYHVKSSGAIDTIALHNFKNGYCGFSKIEDEKYCLCYMTTAENLKACGNSLKELEKNVLRKNPALERVFADSEVVEGFPITISQINFSKKVPVEKGIFMLGDAAGTITPLCGNGMSMALNSSKMLASLLYTFFEQGLSRTALEVSYTNDWNEAFSKRLQFGRTLQTFFGNATLSNVIIRLCKTFPFLIKRIITKTHGQPF